MRNKTLPYDYETAQLKKDPIMGDRPADTLNSNQRTRFQPATLFKFLAIFLLGIAVGILVDRSFKTEAQHPVVKEVPTKTIIQTHAAATPEPGEEPKQDKPVPEKKPIPNQQEKKVWSDHPVTPGETLNVLSAKYGVSVKEILDHNGGRFTPRVGKVIKMPAANFQTHRVVKGETLIAIAKKHHTSVQNLIRFNAIRGNRIKVGQELRLN
ncbi:MAG: hypothetical protein CSA81_04760 [Acidobacteria bacterium]|nr:MAG: hypothetical protein CSA81_04760 [Acidobacteriota bacterium]